MHGFVLSLAQEDLSFDWLGGAVNKFAERCLKGAGNFTEYFYSTDTNKSALISFYCRYDKPSACTHFYFYVRILVGVFRFKSEATL